MSNHEKGLFGGPHFARNATDESENNSYEYRSSTYNVNFCHVKSSYFSWLPTVFLRRTYIAETSIPCISQLSLNPTRCFIHDLPDSRACCVPHCFPV